MHCACSERENSAERDQRKHCIVQRACKRVESGERGERGWRNGVGGKHLNKIVSRLFWEIEYFLYCGFIFKVFL